MPRLVIKSQEFEGKIFELSGQSLTVGRGQDNSIQLAHPSISSHHAELKLEGGDYRLVDLNSTNGSKVNDERVTSNVLLRNHDVVMLGNILMSYLSENALTAPPLPEPGQRIVLSGSGSARPDTFVNLAPFAKAKKRKGAFPVLILLGFLLALAGVGYLAYSLFLT